MADTTVPTMPDGKPLKGRALASCLKFIARLEELGATLIEPHWLGAMTQHQVRCAYDHECSPRAGSVISGQGVCRTCAGNDPRKAEADFRSLVESLGGTVVGEYRGVHVPVGVRCANGHECSPRPGGVRRGQGICRSCAFRDEATLEAEFRAEVTRQGGEALGAYTGFHSGILVRCQFGHENSPSPANLSRGGGICRTCAGHDPSDAEARFRSAVERLSGVVLGVYRDTVTPVPVRCERGHDSYPYPGHVIRGVGICGPCRGKVSDVFYVVTGERGLKLGVTSGDPRGRLSDHRRDGYDTVVRLFEGLEGTTARDLERELIALLKAADVSPVRGREYYPIEALDTVLYVVDDWLS